MISMPLGPAPFQLITKRSFNEKWQFGWNIIIIRWLAKATCKWPLIHAESMLNPCWRKPLRREPRSIHHRPLSFFLSFFPQTDRQTLKRRCEIIGWEKEEEEEGEGKTIDSSAYLTLKCIFINWMGLPESSEIIDRGRLNPRDDSLHWGGVECRVEHKFFPVGYGGRKPSFHSIRFDWIRNVAQISWRDSWKLGEKKPNKKQKCIQSPENGTGKWNTGDPNSLATIKPRCHVSACLLSRSALPNQRPGRVETIPTIEFPSSACHLPQSSLTPSG